MTEGEAKYALDKLEFAIIEAQHKLANNANKEYVERLKCEMIKLLVKNGSSK